MWLQFSMLFKDNVSISLAAADILCYESCNGDMLYKGEKNAGLFSRNCMPEWTSHYMPSASLYLLLKSVSFIEEQKTGNRCPYHS